MKQRKLTKLLQGSTLVVCFSLSTISYAAQQEMLWGKTDDYTALLKKFTLTQPSTTPLGVRLPTSMGPESSVNSLQFLTGMRDASGKSHVRYNQYYQGLPVFGSQLIYHVNRQNQTVVTGTVVSDIEKDVTSLQGKISPEQATNIAVGKNPVKSTSTVEKIIYFKQEVSPKALLAYHVSYASRNSNGPALYSYIIDANNGKILQQWNALNTADPKPKPLGTGMGGTDFRQYIYQFGNHFEGPINLGKFGISVQNGICTIANPAFRVINLKNIPEASLKFTLPVSTADETNPDNFLAPFVYYCTAPDYTNMNDNGFAPINHGFSPVNDTAYFVRQTMNMLVKEYKVTKPIGTVLPLRVYTHLGSYDNAFACGVNCMKAFAIDGPQQLVFGNGNVMFTPMTEADVVAHEFGHLVTDHNSDLIYANQSGGLNESFSDMTGMALNNYIRTALGFSWYPDGQDWNIGIAISLQKKPLRYMSNPPLDGYSIDNLSKYHDGMDTHYSSGIFNKLFYLISTSNGWNIDKAYQIMLDANMKYWTANTTFVQAGCGIIQSAVDKGFDKATVVTALQKVGVVCSASDAAINTVSAS